MHKDEGVLLGDEHRLKSPLGECSYRPKEDEHPDHHGVGDDVVDQVGGLTLQAQKHIDDAQARCSPAQPPVVALENPPACRPCCQCGGQGEVSKRACMKCLCSRVLVHHGMETDPCSPFVTSCSVMLRLQLMQGCLRQCGSACQHAGNKGSQADAPPGEETLKPKP